LAFTLKEIFKEIPFGPAPKYKVSVNGRLRISLDRALDLYKESRVKTLASLYEQKETIKLKTHEAEADLEEVSASCGHFSFSLLEFGEQLKEMLAILDELQLEVEERPYGRSWSWLKFWRWSSTAEAAKAESLDTGASKITKCSTDSVSVVLMLLQSQLPDPPVRRMLATRAITDMLDMHQMA
jgi:hypothetical protein